MVRLDRSCLIEGFLGRAGWEGQLDTSIFYTEHTSACSVHLFPSFFLPFFLFPFTSSFTLAAFPSFCLPSSLPPPLIYLTVSLRSLLQCFYTGPEKKSFTQFKFKALKLHLSPQVIVVLIFIFMFFSAGDLVFKFHSHQL